MLRNRFTLNAWEKTTKGYLFFLYHQGGLVRNEKFFVDYESFPVVKNVKWYYHGGYVASKKVGLLHRFLTKAPPGMCVDHINGDTLDNRLCNLRVCSHQGNMRNSRKQKNNTSGYVGVVRYFFNNSKFVAQITLDDRKIHLGIFDTAEEAARAYNTAAKKYFGEFARLNIIKEHT